MKGESQADFELALLFIDIWQCKTNKHG